MRDATLNTNITAIQRCFAETNDSTARQTTPKETFFCKVFRLICILWYGNRFDGKRKMDYISKGMFVEVSSSKQILFSFRYLHRTDMPSYIPSYHHRYSQEEEKNQIPKNAQIGQQTFFNTAKLTWSANSVFSLSGKRCKAVLISPPPPWILPRDQL